MNNSIRWGDFVALKITNFLTENRIKMANIKHKKGINTIKHFKVSDELNQKFIEKSKDFDSPEDLLREALAEYLFPEKLEITIPSESELSQRHHSISAKVSVDTAFFFNDLATKSNSSQEVLLGQLAEMFAMNSISSGISQDKNFLIIPIAESDLVELDKQFSQTETMIYENFLLDTFRAGLSTRMNCEDAAVNENIKIQPNPSIIEIDLNEIESKSVIESLELYGFDESRYITLEKESKLRDDFQKLNNDFSNENIQVLREQIENELKDYFNNLYEDKIERKDEEIRKLKAENPETSQLIKNFQAFINSTKIVVAKLENYHSLKNVFFKTTRNEIIELYPEHLRHLI